ncbi:MAG TPA: hypothetical protein VIC87_14685 [Vicinamibacteria bacterium]
MVNGIGQRAWPRWLIVGGLVAGTLDILYATVFSFLRSGVTPARVLRYVASGALGSEALQGGAGTAALGLAFHFLIAFLATAVFFAAAANVPKLVEKPVLTGALYGIVVYIVMNYVVVPLSRIGPRPTPPAIVWVSGVLVHMFLIGVPIALAARRGFVPRA